MTEYLKSYTVFLKSQKTCWSLLTIFLDSKKIPLTLPLRHANYRVSYFKHIAELFKSFFLNNAYLFSIRVSYYQS